LLPRPRRQNPEPPLSEKEDCTALVHCFAGCEYRDVIAAIRNCRSPSVPRGKKDVW